MRFNSFAILAALALPIVAGAKDPLDRARIPELEAKLADADPEIRGMAAAELRKYGPEARQAVRALVRMLDDRETYDAQRNIGGISLYDAAFFTLIEIGSESVADLTTALTDSSAGVRSRAAEALGRIGTKASPALPQLIHATTDGDEFVQRMALVAIVQIDVSGDRAVPVLLARANDPDRKLRNVILEKLGEYPQHASKSVPILLAGLASDEAEIRGRCAHPLGKLGSEPEIVVPALTKLLSDNSEYWEHSVSRIDIVGFTHAVSVDATQALAKFGDAAATAAPALAELILKARSGDVAKAAALVFGELGPAAKPHLPQLRQALVEGSISLDRRLAIIDAFAKLGENARSTNPELKNLFDGSGRDAERDKGLELAAACALVAIDVEQNPRALERVLEAVNGWRDIVQNDDDQVRVWRVLHSRGVRPETVVTPLIKLLERAAGSGPVIAVLGKIGPDAGDAVPAIIDNAAWWSDRKATVAALAAIGESAIPHLAERLVKHRQFDNEYVGLLEAIGAIGTKNENVVRLIVDASRDERHDVRASAVKTLGRLKAIPEVAIPTLVLRLTDGQIGVREQAAHSLGAFQGAAGPAVPVLIVALKDEYIDVRAAAADALAEIGPAARQAAPALTKALADPNERVQNAAEKALGRLK